MQQKLHSALFMLALFYGLPLAARPQLLLHPLLLVFMLAALIVWFTQPAISAAEARSQQNSDRNSVWVILGLSALSTVAPIVEWAYFSTGSIKSGLCSAIGLCVMAGGIALRLWSIRTLKAYFTSTVQVADSHRLITHGPYRWLRHPSYLGAYLAFAGCAIALQAWVGLAVALVSMGLAYAIRIRVEERALLQAFGSAYAAYQQRSWRMAPGLW